MKHKPKKLTNLEKIQVNNKRFKEFYELEIRNQNDEEGVDGRFENTSATNFFFQKYLLLSNFKAMLSISLIFLSYFAYRFEFNQLIPEEDGIYLYTLVSVFTFLLIIL